MSRSRPSGQQWCRQPLRIPLCRQTAATARCCRPPRSSASPRSSRRCQLPPPRPKFISRSSHTFRTGPLRPRIRLGGAFPARPVSGGPAPAAPDRSELMHRDPNRPEALTAADSNVPVHPEVLHAQADMTPASANPAQASRPTPLRPWLRSPPHPGWRHRGPPQQRSADRGSPLRPRAFHRPPGRLLRHLRHFHAAGLPADHPPPRPPLGVLVLDDGTSMTVDGD